MTNFSEMQLGQKTPPARISPRLLNKEPVRTSIDYDRERRQARRERILFQKRLHNRFEGAHPPSADSFLGTWHRYESTINYVTLEQADSLRLEFAASLDKLGGAKTFIRVNFQKCMEAAQAAINELPYHEMDLDTFHNKADDVIIRLYGRFEAWKTIISETVAK